MSFWRRRRRGSPRSPPTRVAWNRETLGGGGPGSSSGRSRGSRGGRRRAPPLLGGEPGRPPDGVADQQGARRRDREAGRAEPHARGFDRGDLAHGQGVAAGVEERRLTADPGRGGGGWGRGAGDGERGQLEPVLDRPGQPGVPGVAAALPAQRHGRRPRADRGGHEEERGPFRLQLRPQRVPLRLATEDDHVLEAGSPDQRRQQLGRGHPPEQPRPVEDQGRLPAAGEEALDRQQEGQAEAGGVEAGEAGDCLDDEAAAQAAAEAGRAGGAEQRSARVGAEEVAAEAARFGRVGHLRRQGRGVRARSSDQQDPRGLVEERAERVEPAPGHRRASSSASRSKRTSRAPIAVTLPSAASAASSPWRCRSASNSATTVGSSPAATSSRRAGNRV